MSRRFGISSIAAAFALTCPQAAPVSPKPLAERTVFNDSALHAELCAPTMKDEDWRRVCIPRDQGVRRKRPH